MHNIIIIPFLCTIGYFTLNFQKTHNSPIYLECLEGQLPIVYQMCFDTMLTDTNINKGFYFLLKKHKKKYKFKKINPADIHISRYQFNVDDYCNNYTSFSEEYDTINVNDNVFKPRFQLFFSNFQRNTIECIIADYHQEFNNDFWRYTRFGKMIKIRFCFQNKKISNISVELRMAG
jgi:hypothetical protein